MSNPLLVIAALALMSFGMAARAGDSCVRLLDEENRNNGFFYVAGDEAEAAEAYDMLRRCPAQACAVVRYEDGKLGLLAEQRQDAPAFWQVDAITLWVLGRYRNTRHGPVCVLGSYSGGQASVWVYEGLSTDGRYQIDTLSSVSGISDAVTPAEMFLLLRKAQAKARWLPVKPAPAAKP